ncbi:MAG: pyridoxal 5'-phosphate synthase glutaminase subunit PdxT [Chloroflexi bacterium]|nr:pyridoxal 5'-phosphate synthase glutaminase subunit PdxT [Chloroflexota bacterium]
MRIGVLALQGDFAEHLAMLRSLGVEAVEVRTAAQLADLDGLIIPGGESTTIGKLAVTFGLIEPLRARIESGLPVLATCAGLILLASDVGTSQPLIGVMDVAVERNAFGRQLQSFETDLEVAGLGDRPMRAVFIRAPAIRSAGPDVEVLASLPDGRIVAAQQGPLIVAAFHPELSGDTRLHERFLEVVRQAASRRESEVVASR